MKGDLEYRIDPVTYHFERREAIEVIKKSKNELRKLKDIAGFGKVIVSDNLESLPYLGLENIESETGIYVETTEKETFSSAVRFVKGQVLFPKLRPYLNKVYQAEFDGICSTEFHILDSYIIDNQFLAHFLRSKTIVSQTKYLMSGNTLPRLQTEDIYNLLIPIPSKETQQTIINIFEKAYAIKKANEEKAKELLASIDDYLLTELGITLPEKVENTLKNRVFLTNINEVFGKRIDPYKYNPSTVRLAESIEKSPLPKLKLRELVIQSLAGDWGLDESDELDPNNYIKCLVIRATEFDNIYNLRLDNSRIKFRMINRAKFEKLNVQANDLLIEKSGGSEDQPVGRVAIIERSISENQQISFSNFIHKIRIDDTIVYPEYLFYYLKMIHNIKITESMQSQTNGIRNLIMSEYLNQTIVLPELQLQIDIANKIQEIKEQAKNLQNEAKTAIEEAKRTVEVMILGQ